MAIDKNEYELSHFGGALGRGSGIGELMEDLGKALQSGDKEVCMLGGGQPAQIPAVNQRWRELMEGLLANGDDFEKMVAQYEAPQGHEAFLRELAKLLSDEFGWSLTENNLAVTSGGQMAFFLLFNALAGRMANGRRQKILLPLVPEYIGYADQGIDGDLFIAYPPLIEKRGANEFKYRINFDELNIGEEVAAICVSRPTNPSGNVLTDDEIERLRKRCVTAGVPLIIDNAYGAPFPNIIFSEVKPVWDENLILTLSLSKLGLPGTRTGVVVAREEIIEKVASMTAITGLANNNVGQALVRPLIQSGEILKMSQEVIRPFYEQRSKQALQWAEEAFSFDDGTKVPYRIHVSEGALFHWYWFEGLPMTTKELYERLKKRKVLVIPGRYFFFGLEDENWRHQDECIRVTYTMSPEVVKAGITAIAEEVKAAYSAGA